MRSNLSGLLIEVINDLRTREVHVILEAATQVSEDRHICGSEIRGRSASVQPTTVISAGGSSFRSPGAPSPVRTTDLDPSKVDTATSARVSRMSDAPAEMYA